MLPHSNHRPTGRYKACFRVGVSATVTPDLPPPPLSVCDRPRHVFGASMPEAPVDEDHDAPPRKDDVRPPAQSRERIGMNAKAKSLGVER